MEDICVPVLLIGFNRPKCIKKVLSQLSIVKPKKLYVSIDGARETKPGEKLLVEEVKNIVKKINWECETHYKFHKENVGAEVNISSAISWVFEKEEYIIVNEDDIYAPYSFYKFMQDMLLRYVNDTRIGMISGNNFTPLSNNNGEDYLFVRYGHIWGWATWRRVWADYRLDEEIDEKNISYDYLIKVSANDKIALNSSVKMADLKKRGHGRINWDYMFWYYRLKNNYLSIIPRVNLASNIGVEGLHQSRFSLFNFMYADSAFQVEKHPSDVVWNKEYDIYHYKHHFSFSKFEKLKRRVKELYLSKTKYNQKFFKSFFEE